ncbi:MAG: TSUP family transporter [Acidimicrobiia bacterium]
MGAGGIVGGFAGSFLALRLPADLLRRLFAVLLVLVAIRMFNK